MAAGRPPINLCQTRSILLAAIVLAIASADGSRSASGFERIGGGQNPAGAKWSRDTLGHTGNGVAADGDGSGEFDGADHAAWAERFGNTLLAGSRAARFAAGPEPVGVALATMALMIGLARRRKGAGNQEPGVSTDTLI